MNTEELVTLRHHGEIAVISLNRPQRHNALNTGLLSQLLQALKHQGCQSSASLVLRAEGRSFSTGGDLAAFWRHRETIGVYAQELVGLLNRVIMAIYTHPATVVCAVNGQVTGGSLGLLLAADHVIMRRGVTITPYYSVVGFSPDGGWNALLPDIIDRRQAMHWLDENISNDADACLALGLVHEVVENNCDKHALTRAEHFIQTQAGSIKSTRKSPNTNIKDLRLNLEFERESFVSQVQTQQALQGIDQFLRRKEHV